MGTLATRTQTIFYHPYRPSSMFCDLEHQTTYAYPREQYCVGLNKRSSDIKRVLSQTNFSHQQSCVHTPHGLTLI